jgi:hypothetical protein
MPTILIITLACVACYVAGAATAPRRSTRAARARGAARAAVAESDLADARVLIEQIRQDVTALSQVFSPSRPVLVRDEAA